MKKIVLAALGATLIAGFAVNDASAAQRRQTRGTSVQAPIRADDNFRNSFNAYDRGYETRATSSGLAEGGAISAPAGR